MKFEELDPNIKYVDRRVSVIKINEKKILYTDYSSLSNRGHLEFFDKIYKWTKSITFEPYSTLNLVNGEDNKLNKEILDGLKKITSELIRKYTKKTAIYGLSNLQRVFINALNKFSGTNMMVFKTREQAITWLIKD